MTKLGQLMTTCQNLLKAFTSKLFVVLHPAAIALPDQHPLVVSGDEHYRPVGPTSGLHLQAAQVWFAGCRAGDCVVNRQEHQFLVAM